MKYASVVSVMSDGFAVIIWNVLITVVLKPRCFTVDSFSSETFRFKFQATTINNKCCAHV